MTGYKNYRPVHEHMADVTAFHKRNGRMPKGGKMVSAEERSAHRSLLAVRRVSGIPAHWLPVTTDTFAQFVEELVAWMVAHNGLFPRNRPNTEEGRLRQLLNGHRRTAPSRNRKRLLDECVPGWDAALLHVGEPVRFYPPHIKESELTAVTV